MRVNLFNKRPSEVLSSGASHTTSYGDREGFSILNAQFELPEDSLFLDPQSKRTLTICNLFINHQLAVSQIAQLLEEDLGQVVRVLLQRNVVRDRRGKPSTWPSDVERRQPQPALNHGQNRH